MKLACSLYRIDKDNITQLPVSVWFKLFCLNVFFYIIIAIFELILK